MSLSDETGVSSGPRGCAARCHGAGERPDCEGGDGRCTANGPPIRRGRATDDNPRTIRRTGMARRCFPHLRRPGRRASGRPGECPRSAPRPVPGARQRSGPALPARARPRLRGLCRRRGPRLGVRPGRAHHGRLRPRRRRPGRGGLLFPLRTRAREPLPARLAAVRGLLRDGGLRERRLGLVRSGAGPRGPLALGRRLLLPLLRPAGHRRPARPGQTPCHPGRLGVPRARLLAHRRLAAHALLEPGPRAHRAFPGRERGPRRPLPRLPAARHRAGQYGARVALPAFQRQPRGGQHRDSRPRHDRAVRRAVHLAPAARELPLGPAPRRRLVRRLAAPRRAPGRAPQGAAGSRALRTTGARAIRAAVPSAAHCPPSRRTSPPPSAPWEFSTTSSTAAAWTVW